MTITNILSTGIFKMRQYYVTSCVIDRFQFILLAFLDIA